MINQDTYYTRQKEFFNGGIVGNSRPLSTYMRIFQISHRDIKKLLNNKKLLLVGGGHSQIQRAFDFANIKCDVTNADPYINDARSARTVINCDFNDTRFENEFDEIWALYSLPLYSPDVKHAAQFYRRAVVALKPGGTLRVGGLPWHVNGMLLAPVHFPRDSINFEMLDLLYNSDTFTCKYTTAPVAMYTDDLKLTREEDRHWEKWTAPKNAAIKQALNEHIKKTKIRKELDMHTEMIKIFEIRGALLKRCNPKFYKAHEQIIKQSSLAAQDFYFSGDLAEYENCSTNELLHDSFYASLHAAYNIPYNTHDSRCVNCGLVIDLANALREDIKSGILDAAGGLQNPTRLQESHILQTYHNSPESGTPIEAFARMSKNARETFIRLYHKQKQQ